MEVTALASGLLLFVVIFIFVTGANDGGVLIAMCVRYRTVPLAWFIVILIVVLVIAPLAFGLAVARTLAVGLVPDGEPKATLGFFLGIGFALVVVGGLSRWGLPTSLTLAIIGGVSGAGVGLGQNVSWSVVGRVLLVGALAPVVGALLGFAFGRLARNLPPSAWLGASLPRAHLVAFSIQCIAYAVNDGQKMIAVTAVAGRALTGHLFLLDGADPRLRLLALVFISVVFVVGMLSTVREVAPRIGLELVPVRPLDAVIAQLAAAGAVMGSSAVGVPVSMTQSVAAGLVGMSGSQGMRRVRWQPVTRIAAAWMVTLPMTAFGAYLVAVLVQVIS